MATIPQIRGALLEEIVLYLLESVGYRTIRLQPLSSNPLPFAIRGGASGLEVQGRGTWHQIDALAACDRTPAFMYPLRLIVEAKCYKRNRPVKIEIVRNVVGVLKDISENYFTYNYNPNPGGDKIKFPRFNYHGAIFSSSGYTKEAQKYAIAHQIFLIQYNKVAVIQPLVNSLLDVDYDVFTPNALSNLSLIRRFFRSLIRSESLANYEENPFTGSGMSLFHGEIVDLLNNVKGSYFGMLQGQWPIHLLSPKPLPAEAFEQDEIYCKVYGYESDTWSFSPSQYSKQDPRWFRLDFDLPEEIANLVAKARDFPERVANLKQEHFSYLDVSGKIGGIYRQVRLKLDEEWIRNYLDKMRKKAAKKEEGANP